MNTTATPPVLFLVMPCYNEEAVLPYTIPVVIAKLKDLMDRGIINADSRALFVDDGSKDATWSLIHEAHQSYKTIHGVKLAKNAGHQKALIAGIMSAKGRADIVITMDSDLQHDINALEDFIGKYQSGASVVYGIRKSRTGDGAAKRVFSQSYYKVMRFMGVDFKEEAADYRLLASPAIDALSKFKESNLFLRALIPMLGFQEDVVYYEQAQRKAGISKYPMKKMIEFAWEGITSFSTRPLSFILLMGCGLSFLCAVLFLVNLFLMFTTTSNMLIFLYLSIHLSCIGLVGAYIGKIYLEVKRRPRYIIEETTLK